MDAANRAPRAVAALLQGGYWSPQFVPQRLYSYSYVLGVMWVLGAAVVGLTLARCLRLPQRRHGGRPTEAAHGRRSTATATTLWTLGRVVGGFAFVYYLLALTTVGAVSPHHFSLRLKLTMP